jgi:hypothetical protein
VFWFETLCQHLLGEDKENYDKSAMTTCARAEIRTSHLSNIRQKRKGLRQHAWFMTITSSGLIPSRFPKSCKRFLFFHPRWAHCLIQIPVSVHFQPNCRHSSCRDRFTYVHITYLCLSQINFEATDVFTFSCNKIRTATELHDILVRSHSSHYKCQYRHSDTFWAVLDASKTEFMLDCWVI